MNKKLFILFFLLQGCVPIPKEYTGCQLFITPSVEESVAEGIDEGVLKCELFPEKEWWLQFQDDQLSHLICRGLRNNPQLDEAFSRLRLAIDDAVIRRSALFPTMGFNVKAEAQYLGANDFFRGFAPGVPPRVTEYLINLDFSYEIDFWGKWKNRYLAAIGNARAQVAETAQVELFLSTAIAATYYRLQAGYQELELLQQQQEALTQLKNLQQQRFTNALDNEQSILMSEEQVLKSSQEIETAQQIVKLEEHLLLNLLGEGPNTPLPIERIPATPQHQVAIPQYLSSNLLCRRPDLMVAIWHAESAAYEVGAAKAEFFPNVNLAALGGLDTVFFNKFFTRDSLSGEFTPALHLPIFTAGRIKANLRAKRNELATASSIYNQRLLDAAKEVADSVTTLKTAHHKRLLQELIVSNRLHNFEIAQNRYQHALSSQLEVLQSQIETINEEIEAVRSQYVEREAAISLIKSVGGGYCADCIPTQPKG